MASINSAQRNWGLQTDKIITYCSQLDVHGHCHGIRMTDLPGMGIAFQPGNNVATRASRNFEDMKQLGIVHVA
jgi:hypothetical protein